MLLYLVSSGWPYIEENIYWTVLKSFLYFTLNYGKLSKILNSKMFSIITDPLIAKLLRKKKNCFEFSIKGHKIVLVMMVIYYNWLQRYWDY